MLVDRPSELWTTGYTVDQIPIYCRSSLEWWYPNLDFEPGSVWHILSATARMMLDELEDHDLIPDISTMVWNVRCPYPSMERV